MVYRITPKPYSLDKATEIVAQSYGLTKSHARKLAKEYDKYQLAELERGLKMQAKASFYED